MRFSKRTIAPALAALGSMLGSVRVGRAGDARPSPVERVRAEIAADPQLGRSAYDALSAPPFLLCRQREATIDEAAMTSMSKSERDAARVAVEQRNAQAVRDLAEKARIFTGVYDHFLATFGKRCGLAPLVESPPRGVGPGTPAGVDASPRLPLLVWIFTDKRTFAEYHESHVAAGVAAGVACFLARPTGWAFLFEENGTDREFSIQRCAALATLSLLDAYARQRSAGAPVVPLPMFFETGLAEWLGAVSMAKDRTLTFVGVNRPRLQMLKGLKEEASKANRKMIAFPVRELVEFVDCAGIERCGVEAFGVASRLALPRFHIQSWEVLRFLDDAEGGEHRAAIGDMLCAWLGRPRVVPAGTLEVVKSVLGIDTADRWKALEKAFERYEQHLLRFDEAALPGPPLLGDWPGYVAPALAPAK